MDYKETLKQVKILLGMEVAPEVVLTETPITETATEITMAADTLSDGTKITYDKLEAGGIIALEDGTPLTTGEYELTDGTKVYVTDGIIDTIEVSMPEDNMPPAEMPMSVEELAKKVKCLEEDLLSLAEVITQMANNTQMSEETITKLSKQIEEISAQPSAEPLHFGKVEVKELTDLQKFMLEIKNKK
jgi:hypothetical protein